MFFCIWGMIYSENEYLYNSEIDIFSYKYIDVSVYEGQILYEKMKRLKFLACRRGFRAPLFVHADIRFLSPIDISISNANNKCIFHVVIFCRYIFS